MVPFSSVPGLHRTQLVEPVVRNKVRVFLMTWSGARGVSFPRTDWIIATVARFNVEAVLMEIAFSLFLNSNNNGASDEHQPVAVFKCFKDTSFISNTYRRAPRLRHPFSFGTSFSVGH